LPTPTSAAVCEAVPAPVSVTLSVPFLVPVTVALNCTVTTQLVPPTNDAPHVFAEILKSPGFNPTMLNPVKVTVPIPALATVIFLPALVVPTAGKQIAECAPIYVPTRRQMQTADLRK